MAGRRFRLRKGINVSRVVTKLLVSVIGLWVGGTIMNVLGEIMNGTCSPFYKGLTLIGWTIGSGYCSDTAATDTNTITATTGTGVLSVVGIVALASIVTEFVEFRL